MSLRLETIRADIEQAVPALRRFARALLARPEAHQTLATLHVLADDLVHETVLLALRSERVVDSFRPIKLSLYASLIGFHAAHLNQIGSLTHRQGAFALEDTSQNHEQGLITALDHLALEDRVVLLLISLEQMSYDETAEILHISRALVIQRLVRARNHLVRHMPGQQSGVSSHPHLRLVK
jgi:RNA polymerase sigma-70 factor (ECF subfamily)